MLGHHDESVDMQPIRHAGTFQGAHEEVVNFGVGEMRVAAVTGEGDEVRSCGSD